MYAYFLYRHSTVLPGVCQIPWSRVRHDLRVSRRMADDIASGPRIAGDNNFHGGASTRVVTITVQRNVHGTVTGAIHGY